MRGLKTGIQAGVKGKILSRREMVERYRDWRSWAGGQRRLYFGHLSVKASDEGHKPVQENIRISCVSDYNRC